MKKLNQSEQIMFEIDSLLGKGYENKEEIYQIVQDKLKVPRPTIRRCSSTLKKNYEIKITALEKSYEIIMKLIKNSSK